MNHPRTQASYEVNRHFPRGRAGSDQNMFRCFFVALRQHVLGRKATRRLSFEETVEWATDAMQESFPGFTPTWA